MYPVLFFKAVLQRDGAVEYQPSRSRIHVVHTEVAQPQELEGRRRLGSGQEGLGLAAGEDFQRGGIETVEKILIPGVGIGIQEKAVVQPWPSPPSGWCP